MQNWVNSESASWCCGAGQFIDDLTLAGLAHGYVLRSPRGHALITGLDGFMQLFEHTLPQFRRCQTQNAFAGRILVHVIDKDAAEQATNEISQIINNLTDTKIAQIGAQVGRIDVTPGWIGPRAAQAVPMGGQGGVVVRRFGQRTDRRYYRYGPSVSRNAGDKADRKVSRWRQGSDRQ